MADKQNKLDIVVIGGCVIDLISYVPRFPQPGETIVGYKFSEGFGGKGANQCVTASKLGAHTAMIGKVGNDTYGMKYLENLKKLAVNTDYVTVCESTTTGMASIAVEKISGQNTIVYVAGANEYVTKEDILKAQDLIVSAKVLVCQLEISLDATSAAMKLAKQHGVCTILNPAPAQKYLDDDMFRLSDIFCPNETEASTLTGLPVNSIDDAKEAASFLLQKGCCNVIITLGKNGCVLATRDAEPVHIDTAEVPTADTTGAGDAFVGSLAYYKAHSAHLSMAELIKRANHIAGMSVQREGTQTSFPWQKDVTIPE